MIGRNIIYTAALIFLPLLAYGPSLSGDFLWDDYQLINNPLIREADGLSRIWFSREAIDYYPIYYSAFWLQWRIWGETTTGYHAVNLLFHILNSLLLWRVLARMGFRSAPLCAVLFAIHPVNAATVGWISEQKNTISLFFALLSSLSFVRWAGSRDWTLNRRFCLALIFYALALLTKPAVILLPFVFAMGLIAWTVAARDDAAGGRRWWRAAAAFAPFFILALGSALVTMWFQHNRAMDGEAVRVISWAERLTLAGQALWFYFGKALWPLHHCMIYPKDTLLVGLHWIWPWAGWGGMMVVGFRLLVGGWPFRQRHEDDELSMKPAAGFPCGSLLFFSILFFTLMLVPVLGFVDQGYYRYSYVAEHWMYPALAGVLLLFSEALTSMILFRRGGRGMPVGERAGNWTRWIRITGRLAAVGMIGFYLAVSWSEAKTYADAVVYYRKALECNPDNIVAHHNMANELVKRGDIVTALAHYREALRIDPKLWRAHLAIGSLMLQRNDLAAAGVELEQALTLAPDEPEPHFLAGLWRGMKGDHSAAAYHFETAWRADPGNHEALFNLGLALYQSGRRPEAHAILEEVLRRQPDHEKARRVLETKFQGESGDAPGNSSTISPSIPASTSGSGALCPRPMK